MDKGLLSYDGLEDGQEEAPANNVRRVGTISPELDLPMENEGDLRFRFRNPLRNGLRHFRSDESDYISGDCVMDGSGSCSSGYISLRDMLPSPSAPSPTSSSAWRCEGEILIRNRLVKQAAYAYLQPLAVLPGSARGRGLLGRPCCDSDGCFGFVGERLVPAVRRALRRVLDWFRWRRGGRRDP